MADVHALRPARRPRSSTTRFPRPWALASTSSVRARTSRSSPAATWYGAALEAAETLEREDGVEAEVVNVSIIKPIDSQGVPSLARQDRGWRGDGRGAPRCRRTRRRRPPGCGRAASGSDLRTGDADEFGVSGTAEACMEHFGLTASGIADLAREACSRSRSCSTRPFRAAPGPSSDLRAKPVSIEGLRPRLRALRAAPTRLPRPV